jgi:hypothetical protein
VVTRRIIALGIKGPLGMMAAGPLGMMIAGLLGMMAVGPLGTIAVAPLGIMAVALLGIMAVGPLGMIAVGPLGIMAVALLGMMAVALLGMMIACPLGMIAVAPLGIIKIPRILGVRMTSIPLSRNITSRAMVMMMMTIHAIRNLRMEVMASSPLAFLLPWDKIKVAMDLFFCNKAPRLRGTAYNKAMAITLWDLRLIRLPHLLGNSN